MKISNAKKYLFFLSNSRKKVINVEDLSKGTNIIIDAILDDFIIFDPLLRMYDDYNFKNFTSQLEDYINNSKKNIVKKSKAKNKKKLEYSSLKDFLYDRMLLPGGFIDRSYEFSDEDLKTIRLICSRQLRKGK